ncbi:MAG: hypothetical protein HY904_18555 [Deltaproteobacteria bacterium]|nr:hypothetical protein [Deltaproteobacteria bacterium]
MSGGTVKGRRAADRRRERESDDEGESLLAESTMPGRQVPGPDPSGFDDGGGTATRGPDDRKSKTSMTSLTNVGQAAKQAMKQDPLEQTAVRPIHEGPLPLSGRLICLEGKDVGKTFDLTHDVMVIGRGAEAHLKLTDPGVSRVAFEIRFDAGELAYRYKPVTVEPCPHINGEEAAGERVLDDGDVLETGETTLRFIRQDGPAPIPRETPKPREPSLVMQLDQGPGIVERTRAALVRARENARVFKRLLGVLVVVVLALLVGGVFGFQAWQRARREASLNDPAGAYQTLLKQARQYRESRRWPDLADTALAVDALAADRGDGARLAEEARAEQQAERNLALGRMNYSNGNQDAARSALRLIPDGSVYRADRDQLLERVNEVGRTASVAGIRKLLELGRYEEVAERCDQHLLIYPGDAEVAALRAHAVRSQLAREAQGSGAWQATRHKALQSLEVSDFSGAILIVERALDTPDRALAQSFLGRLKSLQAEWKAGREKLSRKDARAVEPLSRAKALEAELGGGKTPLSQDIARALGDAHYLAGVDLLQKNRDCDARAAFDRALSERPGDTKVVDKLNRLANKGRELLGKAEAARVAGSKGEAARLGREAACRLPRGEEDRARAEKLAGGRG